MNAPDTPDTLDATLAIAEPLIRSLEERAAALEAEIAAYLAARRGQQPAAA